MIETKHEYLLLYLFAFPDASSAHNDASRASRLNIHSPHSQPITLTPNGNHRRSRQATVLPSPHLCDVCASDADLALSRGGEVVHLGHVDQFDVAAGQRGTDVVRPGVSLQG